MWRLVLLGLALACSRPAPSEPRAIDRLETAIDKGDYFAAYDLMPGKFRAVYSKADFVRMMAGEAVIRTPRSVSPPETFTNATPRDAVRWFVLAWKRQRWDLILALVPTRYRERLTTDKLRAQFDEPAQRALLLALADSMNNPIAEDGDRARMAFGSGYQLRLVLEPDGWKIEDLD